MRTHAALLSLFASLAVAWDAPQYSGYTRVWQSTFGGSSGTSPDQSQWNIITGNLGVNAEWETYSSSTRNLQVSGGNTLQIVPWRDSSVSGGWTSGRVESKYTFTPTAGKRTMGEAQVRFGTASTANKKGIWPAFWLLGDSLRHGTGWPACGELDVLETVNGQLTGYGTVHCDVYPGGICNEGQGIGSTIGIPDQDWHTWRIVWDRTPSSWQGESITWFMDGRQFHQITGSRIGNQNVWNSLCHSPMYFILNVAVGGSWVSDYLLSVFLWCQNMLTRLCSPATPTAAPRTATAA
jgi:beta-glucanase (GH16 family)